MIAFVGAMFVCSKLILRKLDILLFEESSKRTTKYAVGSGQKVLVPW